MTEEFVATAVANEVRDQVLIVGVSENPTGSGRYLLFQRALGEPNIHVELDGQGRSCYEGVLGYELGDRALVVSFNPAGAEALGCDAVRVRLEVNAEMRADLAEGLSRVFA